MEVNIFENEDRSVIFEEDDLDQIGMMVINWFVSNETFEGEVLMQCDDTIINAPDLLADIADKFLITNYKD